MPRHGEVAIEDDNDQRRDRRDDDELFDPQAQGGGQLPVANAQVAALAARVRAARVEQDEEAPVIEEIAEPEQQPANPDAIELDPSAGGTELPTVSAERRAEKLAEVEERRRQQEVPSPGVIAVKPEGKALLPDQLQRERGIDAQIEAGQPIREERARRRAENEATDVGPGALDEMLKKSLTDYMKAHKAVIAQAKGSTVYKPAELAALRRAGVAAMADENWIRALEIGEQMVALARKIIDFEERLAALPTEVDQLEGEQLRGNLRGWIEEHRAASWSDQSGTSKPGLVWMEKRLIDYRGREAAQRNREQNSAAALGAASREGRIAANGTIIDKRTVGSFSTEEEAALQIALDAIGNGDLHTWGGKWAEAHGNYQGRLPGVPGAGTYREYYVRPAPGHGRPGPRRLVRNRSGRCFYSWTHYGDSGNPAYVVLDGI